MITTASYKPHKKSTIDYTRLIVTNKAVVNFDPTKTTGLRNAFVRQMDIRFNNLKYTISKAIVDQDCFGLVQSTGKLFTNVASRADAFDSLPGHKAFAFSRDPEKMDSFMSWLNSQEKAGILKTTKINQLGSAAEEAWTNTYIQDSYKRGVQRATYEMGKAGVQLPDQISSGIQATINTPFHVDRVGLLYTRTFSDLKGITQAMDTKISQILAQGLVDGDNPRVLAKKINDQVDGIGKTRARTLARTEIIRAHHSGMVGEYKNYGIAGVKVKAEWVTAGFNVCPKCQSLEGKIYTLAEIEGMIPFHPNCRCMALPIVDDSKVKEVEKVKETIAERIPVNTAKGVLEYMEKEGFRKLNPKEAQMFAQKYNTYMKGLDIAELDSELMALQEKYGFKWTKKSIEDTAFRKGMDIVYTGEYNGSDIKLIRSFYKRDGVSFVEHELFKLPQELQGKGMSKDVLASYYKQYKNAKINFVSTHANIDVGGYAWGKYGFEVARDQANDILKTFNNTVSFKQDAKDAMNLFFKYNPTRTTFPMNIWANETYGKNMLLGSDWSGQLNLLDKDQLQVFESYLFKKK
jgi:SPP1 gp7 family putative phage head morphogenesis protein